MFVTPAYAQSAGLPAMGDFMGMILPLVLIMGVFYFLLIRPQRRRMKEQTSMQSSLRAGDAIITTSGMYRFLTGFDGDIVWLDVPYPLPIRVARAALPPTARRPARM